MTRDLDRLASIVDDFAVTLAAGIEPKLAAEGFTTRLKAFRDALTSPAAPSAEACRSIDLPKTVLPDAGIYTAEASVSCNLAGCTCGTRPASTCIGTAPTPAASFEEAVLALEREVYQEAKHHEDPRNERSGDFKAARQRVVEMYREVEAERDDYCKRWVNVQPNQALRERAEKAEAEAARVKAIVERIKSIRQSMQFAAPEVQDYWNDRLDAALADVKP